MALPNQINGIQHNYSQQSSSQIKIREMSNIMLFDLSSSAPDWRLSFQKFSKASTGKSKPKIFYYQEKSQFYLDLQRTFTLQPVQYPISPNASKKSHFIVEWA